MIKRTEVGGRKATVAYLLEDFTPVDEDDAELVKIIFDDGEIRFAVRATAKDPISMPGTNTDEDDEPISHEDYDEE